MFKGHLKKLVNVEHDRQTSLLLLYPSLLFQHNLDALTFPLQRTILETLRVKAKFSPPDVPVLPYVLTQITPYDVYTEVCDPYQSV